MKPLVLILLGAFLAGETAVGQEIKPEDLPRTKPVEPQLAVQTFQVRKGFHIELAASEPMVVDPIAMSFDERGRLFVVEMRDYSERRAEKLGRIRMLEDLDRDGKFDKSTVFLDHLPWPTAVFCYGGGVLVGACPDILFAKDTDNDGRADDVKTLFTGFGSTQEKLNVQGLFNNLIWGLDNRIHGCSGHDGGLIKQQMHPEAPPIDVRNRGFVIDPRNWSMSAENGGGQYGLSFDQAGRLFTCSNSSHIETFLYDWRYASQNPYYTMPDARVAIAVDGPAAEVFRISPEEPWRVIRTRWRVAGLAPGPVEGGGRSAGYFTGATGITIYRGDAFGAAYVGDAFIGDAGGNLVHHKRIHLQPDGITPSAQRPPDEKRLEFCASTDTWFRPVDFANAPDGCLYIADMYREVIEHPWSIPESIKKYLDLNSGNDRGRIYRLAPDGFLPPHRADPGAADTAGLVAMLEHPNGWHREVASRLLFEKQDRSAIDGLKSLARKSASPYGRLHALCALDGLNALDEPTIVHAMSDRDPSVRMRAIILAEKFLQTGRESETLWLALLDRADDDSSAVKFQLILTLGMSRRIDRAPLLSRLLAENIGNKWICSATLGALSDSSTAAAVLSGVATDRHIVDTRNGQQLIGELARIVVSQNRSPDVATVLKVLESSVKTDLMQSFSMARGVAEGARFAGSAESIRPALKTIFGRAVSCVGDGNVATETRLAAIKLLAYTDYEEASPPLLAALGGGQSDRVVLAAIQTLDQFSDPRLSDALLAHWDMLGARARSETISTLLSRTDRTLKLLQAIQRQQIRQSDLSAAQINQLLASTAPAVRSLAKTVLVAPEAQRAKVVESFQSALSLSGDAAKGKVLFQSRCISCHRAEGQGFQVGPDLVSVRNSGKEKLLSNILDPSREVLANYVSYLVEARDGQSFLGLIVADTPTTITIRQAYGKENVLARSEIRKMSSQGKSLMPDGLEAGLNPQDLADLIEFVSHVSAEKH
jgi:putative membrane-bound dehydrogenase-like protein